MEEEITLILHIPGKDPFPVVVNSHETSAILETFIEGDDTHTFIYKDITIYPAFTFKWFGINDGTDIYVLPKSESQPTSTCFYRRSHSSHVTPMENLPSSEYDQSPRHKKFQKSFEAPTVQPSFYRNFEDARMKDQYFRKVEGSAICYRKILKRFNYIESNRQTPHGIGSSTVLSDTVPENPSTDELPKFWDDDRPTMNLSTVQSPVSP